MLLYTKDTKDEKKEWLPGNPDYEINGTASIEWYDPKNGSSDDSNYHTQVWLPVLFKKN